MIGLTGEFREQSRQCLQALRLLEEHVNSTGAFKTPAGETVEMHLLIEDDQNDVSSVVNIDQISSRRP